MAIKYRNQSIQKKIVNGHEVIRCLYIDPDTPRQAYMIRPEELPGPSYTPGPNTVIYLPLRTDFVDLTGNYTIDNNQVNIGTRNFIPCARFERNGNRLKTTTDLPFTGYDTFTVSLRALVDVTSQGTFFAMGQKPAEQDPYDGHAIVGGNRSIAEYFQNYTYYIGSWWNDRNTGISVVSSTWSNYIFVQDNNTVKIFINGVEQFYGQGFDYDIKPGPFRLGNDTVSWAYLRGSMNEVILEDKAWTSTDVRNYFNSTCEEYGYLPSN